MAVSAQTRSVGTSGAFDRIVLYALLVIVAFITVFPFYWTVIGSVMTPRDLFSAIPKLWPSEYDSSS